MAMTPREHIEEIRRKKFNIGGEPDPKNEDLHHAVNYLSAELYAKDVHFLMELIQNAEDNEYLEGVQPSLEFVITSRDITATGAPATLLLFNNEKGFAPKNIESICSVGRSTKKGQRKRGYIGEKGIGFKSVFLITSTPYVFSNGYQIRFNEEPCSECKIGYIVPEWVDDNPTVSAIKHIYGYEASLPTTIIVVPLKPDKVDPVKKQLSSIHPEILLFLSKIRKLTVKEDNEDPRLNSVTAVSISSEANFVTRKNVDAESYLLHLSADENCDNQERECSYHMWRQRFPVKQENKVEKRLEVEEWVLTLAFPNGQRLNRGTSSPGVYAFLPTEMVTNLPFIIQADFLLASSRETILLDNKWNQGILACVPSAFISAFSTLVKSVEDAPVSCLPRMFEFLPLNSSPYPALNSVRESIRAKLLDENIIPCETYSEQKIFCKPSQVGRLMPAFWNILNKARKEGLCLLSIAYHGKYVLTSSFDREMYDHILNYLGVKHVEEEWYAEFIQRSNIVLGVSEELYLELLVFLGGKWRSVFQKTSMKSIPLLKYGSPNGDVSLCSVNDVSHQNVGKLLVSLEPRHISWLIEWNREFRCPAGRFFAPKATQEALQLFSKRQTLLEWLSNEVKVENVTLYNYATFLSNSVANDRKLAVVYIHFLYHSLSKKLLSELEVNQLCSNMPLVDNCGRVVATRRGILVPANGSKWVSLIGSNLWRGEAFVELGEDYLRSGTFAGIFTPESQLCFIKTHLRASDVPDITPPDVEIPTMAAPLTKENTFLLLDWIRNFKRKGVHMPSKFLTCVKEGGWMKITLRGSPGYRPPSQSFLPTSSWESLLQNESDLVDISVIDQSFYGEKINAYKDELGAIGVKFEYAEACQFIGKHLLSLAANSTLTRANVVSVLNFIKNSLSAEHFISSIRDGRWLKTSLGYRSPVGCVLFDQEWKAASQISDIPFIDLDYYGEDILNFKLELERLGVLTGIRQSYQFVADFLKPPACISDLSAESCIFVLECLRNLRSSDKFIQTFKGNKFLKTNMGYKSPDESHLFNLEWGCLLEVFKTFPLIDQNCYGRIDILDYKNQLKQLGAVVDLEGAANAFARVFKQQAYQSSIKKENVLLLLACFRKLNHLPLKFPDELTRCISDVNWLRTRLGDYRLPRECILFGPDWKSISAISLLPFIDDSDNCYGQGIYEYEKELKNLGVVLDFKDGYRFVTAGLNLPPDPSSITPANLYSLLECVRSLRTSDKFVKTLKDQKFLKTNMGYKSPVESHLVNPEWGCLLEVFKTFPLIDQNWYGSSNILSYENELKQLGAVVDLEVAAKAFALVFKQQASQFSIGKGNVLLLLACYRKLNQLPFKFPDELKRCICEVNWLRTRLGDYRVPRECILFGPDWESISAISLLPFVDDSDSCYGQGIYEYGKELKNLGVVLDFKDGYRFVTAGLNLPPDPSSITPANLYSLLECISSLLQQKNVPLLNSFVMKVARNWLRTSAGYRSPNKCLLYNSKWNSLLEREDGPFIDEKFYGSRITSYSKELNAIGVTVEVIQGCLLISSNLHFHSKFTTIVRIYSYLKAFNWLPHTGDPRNIWIPKGSNKGEWVTSGECVLYDKDAIFCMQLKVLEKHYEQELLHYFSSTLGVKPHPSLEDYCKLWKVWESSGQQLSSHQCCAFWEFVVNHWNSKTEKAFVDHLLKLPVFSYSDSILLFDKHDVFIADDLLLKDLFEQSSSRTLFVWYPRPSLQSLPLFKLLEVYRKIGIRGISEAVRKEISIVNEVGLKQVSPREIFICKGLLTLILGFLAGPLRMDAEKRHDAVSCLLNLTVCETPEPIIINFSLSLSSGENLNAEARPMIRWERDSKKIFMQKLHSSGGHRSIIERATYFSEAMSSGFLWEHEDHVSQLSELIKVGFLLEFDEEAIGFLMKTKNLQLHLEDERFLSSAFPSLLRFLWSWCTDDWITWMIT